MKPGDTIETAIWLDGRETPQARAQFEADVSAALVERASAENAVLAPVKWSVKRLGEDRVPEAPDHIQGPDVRLLVAEADVLSVAPTASHFLSELEPRDLTRLRQITRRGYRRAYPGQGRLTDRQCDTLINDLGPEAAVAALERGNATIQ